MPAAPRRLAVATLALLFAAVACSDGPSPTGLTPEPSAAVVKSGPNANPNIRASGAPGAPEPISQTRTFRDSDPCTGAEHTVTIESTIWVHRLTNGNQLARWQRTITTDTGYEGRGSRTEVNNGNVFKLTNNDIVSHPDGRTFRAHGVMVLDLTTAPPTVRVQKGGFTCVRS